MAKDGVSVGPEFAAAVAAFVAGGPMNVTESCARLGVSRAVFYKYVARFRDRGVAGLFPDSRRPVRSPGKLPAAAEEVLVRIRKEQAEDGWDYGADAVLFRLAEQPQQWPEGLVLPSRATINRVFASRGLLAPVPRRRPRRAVRRFQREKVNELWQVDGFETRLADGRTVVVLHLIDDCSRTDLALLAAVSENSTEVWAAFCAAAGRYGLPQAVLSDNGTAFSLHRRGMTAPFERQLEALGIRSITSRVGHPQTCGKVERGHQRVIKWLNRRDPAADLPALQVLLDTYCQGYNTRKNTVLGGLTPHQRFTLGPFAGPDSNHQARTLITTARVADNGQIGIDNVSVGLGRTHAGKNATVFRQGDRVTVFVDDQFATDLIIDRTRRYQPRQR
jgi:transposase InsO family protein/transposase